MRKKGSKMTKKWPKMTPFLTLFWRFFHDNVRFWSISWEIPNGFWKRQKSHFLVRNFFCSFFVIFRPQKISSHKTTIERPFLHFFQKSTFFQKVKIYKAIKTGFFSFFSKKLQKKVQKSGIFLETIIFCTTLIQA